MTDLELNDLKQTILAELDVLEDDIYVAADEDTMTFYLSTDQLDQARNLLDGRVEVLASYDYEYLVKNRSSE